MLLVEKVAVKFEVEVEVIVERNQVEARPSKLDEIEQHIHGEMAYYVEDVMRGSLHSIIDGELDIPSKHFYVSVKTNTFEKEEA